METIEGNKLIAEFMGGVKTPSFYLPTSDITEPISDFEYQTPYHTSWDWLMPVVEKIALIMKKDDAFFFRTFGAISIETGNFMVRFNSFGLHTSTKLIEAVWLAVLEFIKWYNQNKN